MLRLVATEFRRGTPSTSFAAAHLTSSSSAGSDGGACHCVAGARGVAIGGDGSDSGGDVGSGPGGGGRRRRRRRAKNEIRTNREPELPEAYRSWEDVREVVRRKARALGLGPTHFAPASPPSKDRLDAYQSWLDAGMHGEMAYLARPDRIAWRSDPQLVLSGARSVIVSSLFYWPGRSGFPWSSPQAEGTRPRGKVSAYAWGDDYHDAFGAKLSALASWTSRLCGGSAKFYVDTGEFSLSPLWLVMPAHARTQEGMPHPISHLSRTFPATFPPLTQEQGAVLERDFAERSGLSFTGKNCMAIHPQLGSGFFLGAVFTTLPLPPDAPLKRHTYCGACTKCQRACPTGALATDR